MTTEKAEKDLVEDLEKAQRKVSEKTLPISVRIPCSDITRTRTVRKKGSRNIPGCLHLTLLFGGCSVSIRRVLLVLYVVVVMPLLDLPVIHIVTVVPLHQVHAAEDHHHDHHNDYDAGNDFTSLITHGVLSYRAPLDAFNWLMSVWTSAAESPDVFAVEPMNCVIAVASPVVPAVDCIMVPPPPIMPPPMPPIVIDVLPIMPFITPSEASFIIAVIIPEESAMPIFLAYCDIAAIVAP